MITTNQCVTVEDMIKINNIENVAMISKEMLAAGTKFQIYISIRYCYIYTACKQCTFIMSTK